MQAKETTAKVFMDNGSRAVRIPTEFVLEGDEVTIRQEKDGAIIIQPTAPTGLLDWLATLEPLDDEEALPEITDDDLPPLRDVKL
jgi:antitoxin VapB